MAEILNTFSLCFIPAILSIIIGFGFYKKAPVYDYFVEGVKEGLKSAVEIMPFLIAIFVGIEALSASGVIEALEKLAAPFLGKLGVPEELTSLILLRPVSGSGSLGVLEHILAKCGPDSFAGRCASVMLGSCETVFYVFAVYFSVTAVERTRYCLPVGLLGYAAGVIASVAVCRVF